MKRIRSFFFGKKLVDTRWPIILLALAIALVVIPTSGLLHAKEEYNDEYTLVKSRVLWVDNTALMTDPYVKGMYIGQQPVKIKLLSGTHKGESFEVVNMMSRAFNIYCKQNMVILTNIREIDGKVDGVDIFGYNRDTILYAFLGLFCAILLVAGHKRGLYSLLALVFTLIIVIFFMIPRILEGQNPVAMALLTAVVSTAITIFLIGGFGAKSIAAIIGTLSGVLAAGAISILVGRIGNISGIQLRDAQEMIYLAQEVPIKVPELLFASIIVSALGAVMDIGMSIASAVFEVKEANAKLGVRELYKSGMNVGRDAMGTMTNTLILAFAGSSMPVLIIIMLYRLPSLRLVNLDLLGIEFIQGISGSIGMILAVPITALCAAFLVNKKKGDL
ncbi:YibE/F family protein [Lachnospiraceae bacterium ZAX-1]